MITLADYLRDVVEMGGSDLHLAAGSPPLVRRDGLLVRMSESTLGPQDTEAILLRLLTPEQRETLARVRHIDIAYQIDMEGGSYRFRGTIYYQKRGLGCVFRVIPPVIPTVEELGLPAELIELTRHHQGLVLVTGPAGSGKTTTLAALVQEINEVQPRHIITIEDPIEYVHQPRSSLIHQRQVGTHTASFSRGLRAAMREDPDVILVGELRDLETVYEALLASETGQLVLASLPNASVTRTLDRIVEEFPLARQGRVRGMLAETLRGIVAQQLLPRADGRGRVPAVELLLGCPVVSSAIREARTSQIPSIMLAHRHLGMRVLAESVQQLVQAGLVAPDVASEYQSEARTLQPRETDPRKEGHAHLGL